MKHYRYIEEYLNGIRAKGGFSFTYDEIDNAFTVTKDAKSLALNRLKSKKRIVSVKKGFYVILPPEYMAKGMIPSNMFIDDLMKSLDKDYYVALFSAAALYGASHQQPMEYFVVTNAPAVRNIKSDILSIHFLVKKEWKKSDVIKKKSGGGYFNVSSPELTALDLLFYSDTVSLNRAYTVLWELSDSLRPSILKKIAHEYPQTASIQRLGYMLDTIEGCEKLTGVLKKALESRTTYNIPLSARKPKKGKADKDWKIIINTDLEGDL